MNPKKIPNTSIFCQSSKISPNLVTLEAMLTRQGFWFDGAAASVSAI